LGEKDSRGNENMGIRDIFSTTRNDLNQKGKNYRHVKDRYCFVNLMTTSRRSRKGGSRKHGDSAATEGRGEHRKKKE